MRITNLFDQHSKIYSSNVYLIRGDWNAIADVNTLIDVGANPSAIDLIKQTPTGVGKRAIDQVIFTHSHFDHTSLLPAIRQAFNPVVYAHSQFSGADHVLVNNQTLRCGDRDFRVIYTPGHSNDSICLYCEQDSVLFSGDTPLIITSPGGTYSLEFIEVLKYLSRLDIETIYPGHGPVITGNAQNLITTSLENAQKSTASPPAGNKLK